MVRFCCVDGCKIRGTVHSTGIHLHRFPVDEDLLEKWMQHLRTHRSKISIESRVCGLHFSASHYHSCSRQNRLKCDAVPDRNLPSQRLECVMVNNVATQTDFDYLTGMSSLKKPKRTYEPKTGPLNNLARFVSEESAEHDDDTCDDTTLPIAKLGVQLENFEHDLDHYVREELQNNVTQHEHLEEAIDESWQEELNFSILSNGPEHLEETSAFAILESPVKDKGEPLMPAPSANMTNGIGPAITVSSLNEEAIHYLTGYTFKEFEFIYYIVMHDFNHCWRSSIISLKDQLLLTLMKFRMNFDYTFFAILFRINRHTVCAIFKEWLEAMYTQLTRIDLWSLREVGKNMYTVLLDCTEFIIEKPSTPRLQQATFSRYKNKNTLKLLVGIDEQGVITFVSSAYGGASSDDIIVKKSAILDLLNEGDHILADRGFENIDEFVKKGVVLNKPPNKMNIQFTAAELASTRAYANRRANVERLIGLGKTNRIVTQVMAHHLFPMANKIITVVFRLSNVKRAICKDFQAMLRN